jgi:PTH1 family peptidyl-tRNA hydrolase
MRLLVGLGNPGPDYAHHRHNLGFMAVDAIARRHALGWPRARFHGRLREGTMGAVRVATLEPETYMNDSGRAVAAALRFYKLDLDRVVVIHDEIDLDPGRVKVKFDGGPGGHNGLRSLDAHVGPGYWRVRVGVGHPGHRDLVERYVLHDFSREERALIDRIVEAIAEALPLLLAGRDNAFMSKVDVLVHPRPAKPPRVGGNGADQPPAA